SRSIRATADKKVTVLLAQAGRDANILRGQGDACRNRIFAAAYGLSPDFFAFYRSMQSYEKALESGQTSFVLSPNSAFFRYISNPNNLLQTIKKEQKNNDRQKNNILRIIQNGESLQENICPEIAQIAE
ncbi:MAG: protease modulator HflC, partial [Parvibaculales bacterium]